jgi:protein-glutamine gamma-glutamyltransferase
VRTPPLLVGVSLLFWGWQSGYLALAMPMALLYESSHLTQLRWEFTDRDFNRLWNFTAMLFLGAMVYAFTSREGPNALRDLWRSPASTAGQSAVMNQTARAMLVLLQWLPMVFFLFVTAQAFSQRQGINLSTLSWIVRWARGRSQSPAAPQRLINVTYPYFGLCVIAACIGQPGAHRTYLGISVLVAWALWRERSRRYALSTWVILFALAMSISFVGNRGLEHLRGFVESFSPDWFAGRALGGVDAKENRTSLGSVGRLKLSGKIVFRLDPKGDPPPERLREASYSIYKNSTWYGAGSDTEFQPVLPASDESSWTLRTLPALGRTAGIAGFLPNGRGILPLPSGIARIENLPVMIMQSNRMGVIRVDAGPGFLMFDTTYSSDGGIDAPPNQADKDVPESERAPLAQIVAQLNLDPNNPPQSLSRIYAFFTEHFQYSLELTQPPRNQTNQTPLCRFLLDHRSGHCEYFATAAALLLRQAGWPTRYAVGYAVQEPSGHRYIVRERHAHAWCLVYHHGAWHDFDPTPAGWFQREAKGASPFEWLTDLGSRLWFEFTQFRHSQSTMRTYLLWLVLPLLAISFWQLIAGKQWKRSRQSSASVAIGPAYPGLDSELYQLEHILAQCGLMRSPGENLSSWLRRCQSHPTGAQLGANLETIVQLHNRLRFDPHGLKAAERETLRTLVEKAVRSLGVRESGREVGACQWNRRAID